MQKKQQLCRDAVNLCAGTLFEVTHPSVWGSYCVRTPEKRCESCVVPSHTTVTKVYSSDSLHYQPSESVLHSSSSFHRTFVHKKSGMRNRKIYKGILFWFAPFLLSLYDSEPGCFWQQWMSSSIVLYKTSCTVQCTAVSLCCSQTFSFCILTAIMGE